MHDIRESPPSTLAKTTGDDPRIPLVYSPLAELSTNDLITDLNRDQMLAAFKPLPIISQKYRKSGASLHFAEDQREVQLRIDVLMLFASQEGFLPDRDTHIRHGLLNTSDSLLKKLPPDLYLHSSVIKCTDADKNDLLCGAVTLPNGDYRLWVKNHANALKLTVDYPRHELPGYLEHSITLPGAPVNRIALFEELRDNATKNNKLIPASILAQAKLFIKKLTDFSIQLPFRSPEIDQSLLPSTNNEKLQFFDPSFAKACRSYELLADFAHLSALAKTLSSNLSNIIAMTEAEDSGLERMRDVLHSSLRLPIYDDHESLLGRLKNRGRAFLSRFRDSMKSLEHAKAIDSIEGDIKRALIAAYLLECSEGKTPNQIITAIASRRDKSLS